MADKDRGQRLLLVGGEVGAVIEITFLYVRSVLHNYRSNRL